MQIKVIEYLVYIGIFLTLYFSIFIFLTFFENRKKIYRSFIKQKFLPHVCLIVPCYNEADNIEKTLDSLINLDYPREKLEIIVVDDGSKDNTFFKAKNFAKKDARIKVFRKKNGGKHTALNYALKHTKAPFVGSVDGDSFLNKDALKKLMSYFEEEKVMAVISTVKINKPKTILEKIQSIEYLIAAFLRKIFSFLDSVNVAPGPLSVFRRKVFKILGNWHQAHQTEDLELAFRIQKANFKIAHAIEAVVYTTGCKTLKSLFKQRLRWRRGFLLNLLDYLELLNIKKHGNLSFFLYYNLLSSIFSIFLISYSIWRATNFLFKKFNYLTVINFDVFHSLSLQPDWLSFGFKHLFFLVLISLFVFLNYLFFGKKLTFDKTPLKEKTIFYLLVYSFLNACWWVLAILFVFLKKKIAWS